MRLTEILRKTAQGFTGPSAPEMFQPEFNKLLKPLTGSLKYYYDEEDGVHYVQIVDTSIKFEPKTRYHEQLIERFNGEVYRVLADLTLNDATDLFPFSAVQVDTIYVDKDFQNKGYSRLAYKVAFKETKSTLVAGNNQTPGGRRNWVSLDKMPEVEVIGYIRLLPRDIEDSDIMEKVLERGGQYEGKRGKYHFFLFEAFKSTDGSEMAIDHENVIRLYHDITGTAKGINSEVGLLARWIG